MNKIVSDKLEIKIFIRFLRDKNAYYNYSKNKKRTLDLSKHRVDAYLEASFFWSGTDEGDTFWRLLNTEWHDICYKLSNIKD